MKIKITNIEVNILNGAQPERPNYLEAEITASYTIILSDESTLSGQKKIERNLLLDPIRDEILANLKKEIS